MIVSDNGTEFTSNAILSWSKEHQVEWHYIAPGKPMQNGYNRSLTAACAMKTSQQSLFLDLDQAGQIIAAWVADYNTARPHSSLGYKTPAAYAESSHRRPAIALRYLMAPRAVRLLDTAPKGVINSRGSKRHWMNVQWQVLRAR